ncbi:hypothetical protein FKM82_024902 [Ascaphus truei]
MNSSCVTVFNSGRGAFAFHHYLSDCLSVQTQSLQKNTQGSSCDWFNQLPCQKPRQLNPVVVLLLMSLSIGTRRQMNRRDPLQLWEMADNVRREDLMTRRKMKDLSIQSI